MKPMHAMTQTYTQGEENVCEGNLGTTPMIGKHIHIVKLGSHGGHNICTQGKVWGWNYVCIKGSLHNWKSFDATYNFDEVGM